MFNEDARCAIGVLARRLSGKENAAAAGLLRVMRARLTGADQASLEYEIALAPDEEHDYGFGALIGLGRI